MADGSIDRGELSKKDRHDAFMLHAKFAWEDMDARRNYEWKLSLGIWTALGAFAGFVLRGDSSFSLTSVIVVSILLLAVGMIHAFVWTPGLRERQKTNLETARFFLDRAEEELKVASPRKGHHVADVKICAHWSHGTQILLTYILVAVALLAVWLHLKK